MKKLILASACIMALATGSAPAQTQPAPGASGQGDVGPSSRGPATKGMTTGRASNMQNEASDSKGAQPPRPAAPTPTTSAARPAAAWAPAAVPAQANKPKIEKRWDHCRVTAEA